MLKSKSNRNVGNTNIIYTIIASVILIIFLVTLLIFEPNISKNLLNFEKTCMILSTFQYGSVSTYLGVTSSVVIHLSIFTLILAIFSYYYEESKPILSYFFSFLFLFIFNVIYYSYLEFVDLASLGQYINTIKGIASYSLVHALILTICYQAFKGITITITEGLKIRNFLVHYIIFLILFLIGLIGLMLFYDYNLFEPISKFITKVILRR